jgi:hypothetical protein
VVLSLDLSTGQLTVMSDVFEPGEQVTAMLYSTPVLLGVYTADSAGHLEFTVVLPTDLEPGLHRVVLSSERLGEVSASFQYPPDLSGTGVSPAVNIVSLLSLVCLAMAAIGLGIAGRKRRAA